jgi:hypothetical protein
MGKSIGSETAMEPSGMMMELLPLKVTCLIVLVSISSDPVPVGYGAPSTVPLSVVCTAFGSCSGSLFRSVENRVAYSMGSTNAIVTAVMGKFTAPNWLLILSLICCPPIEVWIV